MRDVSAVARLVQRSSLYLLLLLLPISKAAIEIGFGLLLMGWLLEHVPTGWRTSVWRSRVARTCLLALAGYLGVCALFIITSSIPELSLRGVVRKTLEYALFFVMVADVARDPAVLRRGVAVLIASSAVVGLDAIAQEAFLFDPLRGQWLLKYGRMTGPYESPSDLATYLVVLIPLLVVQLGRHQGWARWGLGTLGLVLMGCLIRAGSRGAWLGLLGGGGIAVLAGFGPRLRRALVIGGLSLLVLAGAVLSAGGPLRRVLGASDAGLRDRLVIWQAGWKMIQARPVTGHGPNTFMANYLTYWVGGERQPRYAHNCYLQVWAETGVFGLFAFLWLLWNMLTLWMGSVRGSAGGPERLILYGLIWGLLGFLVQAAFDTSFYALRQATLFWTLAGLVTGVAVRRIVEG